LTSSKLGQSIISILGKSFTNKNCTAICPFLAKRLKWHKTYQQISAKHTKLFQKLNKASKSIKSANKRQKIFSNNFNEETNKIFKLKVQKHKIKNVQKVQICGTTHRTNVLKYNTTFI
jgi:hypothetical protein